MVITDLALASQHGLKRLKKKAGSCNSYQNFFYFSLLVWLVTTDISCHRCNLVSQNISFFSFSESIFLRGFATCLEN